MSTETEMTCYLPQVEVLTWSRRYIVRSRNATLKENVWSGPASEVQRCCPALRRVRRVPMRTRNDRRLDHWKPLGNYRCPLRIACQAQVPRPHVAVVPFWEKISTTQYRLLSDAPWLSPDRGLTGVVKERAAFIAISMPFLNDARIVIVHVPPYQTLGHGY